MRLLFMLIPILLWACDPDLGTARDRLKDTGVPGNFDPPPTGDPPPDNGSPSVTIVAVDSMGDGTIRLRGTARDDRAVVAMAITAGLSGPTPISGRFSDWEMQIEAPPGPTTLHVEAFDASGHRGSATWEYDIAPPIDMVPPTVTILHPEDGHQTNAASVAIDGTTEDNRGVVSVEIFVDDIPIGLAGTVDYFRTWSLIAPLPPAAVRTYRVVATDVGGNTSEATLTVTSRLAPPHGPPQITATDPVDATQLDTMSTPLAITIASEAPLAAVVVRNGDGPWTVATGAEADWIVALRLHPGPNQISIIARDTDNLVGRHRLTITADDGYRDGPIVTLNTPSDPGGDVVLELDREAVAAMFPADLQARTTLIDLDPRDMISNALRQIREGCEGDRDAPTCPDDWGQPEQNLWRLLTMTARTTDVTGTGLQPAARFTERFFNTGILPVNFNGLLAQALQIDIDDLALPNEAVVEGVVLSLIASHPNTPPEGTLGVTLRDGLNDMTTLAETFGPMDGHPGILPGEIRAAVLEDDFLMRLVLNSNLRFFDGVDLNRQRKTYTTNAVPDATAAVDLDFADPERFSIRGLADNPGVTFDFEMLEYDGYVDPGREMDPLPLGNSPVWGIPEWTLERVIAEATWQGFGDLHTPCDLCGGVEDGALLFIDSEIGTDLVEVAIGSNGYDCFADDRPCTNGIDPTPMGIPEHFEPLEDPPGGWFRLWVPAGLVRTPPSMYLWDLILEVAQVRLRDFGVEEGQGSAHFHLTDVPVGLSAAEMEAQVRAGLHAQRVDLAESLLGGYAAYNEPVHLYVDTDASQAPWLVGASCLDPLPADACTDPGTIQFSRTPDGPPIGQMLPDGRPAVAFADLEAGTPIYATIGGVTHRLDVQTLDARSIKLWLRGTR